MAPNSSVRNASFASYFRITEDKLTQSRGVNINWGNSRIYFQGLTYLKRGICAERCLKNSRVKTLRDLLMLTFVGLLWLVVQSLRNLISTKGESVWPAVSWRGIFLRAAEKIKHQPRACSFQMYMSSRFLYEKIPSEMEVAPRYNCWNCWHCWHC